MIKKGESQLLIRSIVFRDWDCKTDPGEDTEMVWKRWYVGFVGFPVITKSKMEFFLLATLYPQILFFFKSLISPGVFIFLQIKSAA